MYAKHKIGVILPVRGRNPALWPRIHALPSWIDRIYVVGDIQDTPLPENPPPSSPPPSPPSENLLSVQFLPADSSSPLEPVGTALTDAIAQHLDVIVLLPENDGKDPSLLSHVIDPIVWGKAEYIRGEWVMDDHSQKPVCFSVSTVSSSEVSSPLDELFHNKYTAFSRTVAIRFVNLLSHGGKRVLAAIPCYNEEVSIGSVVLRSLKYVDEVLVVDDGSLDNTAEVAADAGATVLSHPQNRGYGGAIRSCFEYAREHHYDMMVILDGDGQHNASSIPQFIDAINQNDVDIIIGSRFITKNGDIPLYRKAGMKVLDRATQMAGQITISDSQSGYRLYNRKAIEQIQIKENNMGAGSEILTQACEKGLNVTEIPIEVRYDLEDTSTQHPLFHGLSVLNSLLWYVVEKRPLPLLGGLGFVFEVVGITFAMMLLQIYNQTRYFSLPLSILAAAFTILGSIGIYVGLILHVITRLQYRQIPPPHRKKQNIS